MTWGTSPAQEVASDPWSGGASITITFSSAPVDGNFGVIYYDAASTGLTISSISHTGATWAVGGASSTNRDAEVWYTSALFSSAGNTITINLNGTPGAAGQLSAAFSEWVPPSSVALDATGANSGNSGTPTTASITPTSGKNALIIGCMRPGATISGTHGNPTNGFTALLSSDSDFRSEGAYLVAASTSGSYSVGWSTASGTWDAAIASFIDNSGGGGGRRAGPLVGGGLLVGGLLINFGY